MGALEEDVELERAVTKTGLADGNTTAEMKEGGADGGRIQMTTRSTARTNGHGGTHAGRSQDGVRVPTTSGGARRAGADETQRLGDIVGPGGQDRAVEPGCWRTEEQPVGPKRLREGGA